MQSSGRDDHAQSITRTPTLRVTICDLSFADVLAIMATNRSMSGIYSRDFAAQLKKCLLRLKVFFIRASARNQSLTTRQRCGRDWLTQILQPSFYPRTDCLAPLRPLEIGSGFSVPLP
jgi:hypothetical protein